MSACSLLYLQCLEQEWHKELHGSINKYLKNNLKETIRTEEQNPSHIPSLAMQAAPLLTLILKRETAGENGQMPHC